MIHHKNRFSEPCQGKISQEERPYRVEGSGNTNKPIRLYEHLAAAGWYVVIYAGESSPDLGPRKRQISSILMPPRTKLTLYPTTNYSPTGELEIIENTDSSKWLYADLIELDYNDRAESIRTQSLQQK
jgi:hypothetical protein